MLKKYKDFKEADKERVRKAREEDSNKKRVEEINKKCRRK